MLADVKLDIAAPKQAFDEAPEQPAHAWLGIDPMHWLSWVSPPSTLSVSRLKRWNFW